MTFVNQATLVDCEQALFRMSVWLDTKNVALVMHII